MRVFGVILAGGRGLRLGGVDKASVHLAGRSLLSHVAERLSPQVEALALNANRPVSTYSGVTLPVLADREPGGLGPLAGVLAGLEWAADQGADWLVTAAVDTPFLPCDLVPRLLLAAEGAGTRFALAESAGRRHPTAALWPVDLRDALRAEIDAGLRKLDTFGAARGAACAAFPVDRVDPFLNINTPEELEAAERALS